MNVLLYLSLYSTGCVVAIYLGWTVFRCYKAYSFAYKLCHPKRKQGSLHIAGYSSIDYFDFYTKDGLRLSGIDVRPECPIRGTIILCHYLGGTKEMVINMMQPLLGEGYQLVSFDFRNHGMSQRVRKVRFTLTDDFDAFYKCLLNRTHSRIFGVAGFSMGCTAALYGLCEYPEIKVALIDSGPLLSVKRYFEYVLKQEKIKSKVMQLFFLWFYIYLAGFGEMRNQSMECLSKLAEEEKSKKILFVHGQRDNIIPFSDAETAYHMTQNIATLWMVKGSRHLTNMMVSTNEYVEKITKLFGLLYSDMDY